MPRLLTLICALVAFTFNLQSQSDLVITGVIDGPLSGGVPKAIEVHVLNDIADLSIYGLGSANNGGGSDGEEFTFPTVSASAGSFLYVASESPQFEAFFGFAPDYTSSAASINGDDAIELFQNGSVVDIFGDINVDGGGEPWEYQDGWAYRVNTTGPDGSTFVLSNWTFSGPNALDGETSNATASTPFPLGTYTPGNGGGNECDPDIVPPTAVCQNLVVELNVSGEATITAAQVGGASFDNCTGPGDLILQTDRTTFGCADVSADELIAFTSFEEPPAIGGQYTDTDDASTDHPLVNNFDEPLVNFTGTGGELGFSSFYFNTRNDVGLTDGDFVGVNSFTGTVGSYTDGSQGFQLSDCDGTVETSFDQVDISGFSAPKVFVDLFIQSTGWESNDLIRVYVEFDDNSTLDLLNTSGSDIDDLNIEGSWLNLEGDLSGYNSATLRVSLESNSSSEAIYIDNVRFSNFQAPQLVNFSVQDEAGNVSTCVAEITVSDPTNACGLVPEKIHEVQGSGPSVTRPGEATQVEGIVVGDYQAGDQLRGFFLQEEAADEDGDFTTSEGIFVFCGSCPVNVEEGNKVSVIGIQEEFFGMSQIDVVDGDGMVTVTDAGNNLGQVAPAIVNLPADGSTTDAGTLEEYEGMLIQIPQELTATEYFQLARFGQIVLSEGGKLRQYTNDNAPGVSGFQAYQDEIAARRIILDDLNNIQNFDPVYHPQPGGFAVDNFVRGGYTISNLTGVLHWSFAGSGGTNAWRIRPQVTDPPSFDAANPRQEQPDEVGGDIKVAAFNVLNYFNGDGMGGGFPTSRGADSQAEFERQTAKIVDAILKIDADVIGLVELENDYSDGALSSAASLVNALNTELGDDVYAYVDPVVNVGTDVIAVGFIYDQDVIQLAPGTSVEILDDDDLGGLGFESYAPLFDGIATNRAALAASFRVRENGNPSKNEIFTVAVNHFKSKGDSGLDDVCPDPGNLNCDAGDGQGFWNDRRTKASEVLAAWLETAPTGTTDPDYLIIGDINAYAEEDPVTTLETQGYSELIERFGVQQEAYSFVFDGQWGYLDHALANGNLNFQVTGAEEWHINADEVNLLDYNDEIVDPGEAFFEAKPASTELYAPNAFRSSDHDPLIVGLELDKFKCTDLQLIDFIYDANTNTTTYTFDLDALGCALPVRTVTFFFPFGSQPTDPANNSTYDHPGNANSYRVRQSGFFIERIRFDVLGQGADVLDGERFVITVEGQPNGPITARVKAFGPADFYFFDIPEDESLIIALPEVEVAAQAVKPAPVSEGEGFEVFPNPATKWLQLVFEEDIEASGSQVEIYSQLGQRLAVHRIDMTTENQVRLDIDHLPAGTYFVHLRMENSVSTRKFIKH